MQYSKWRIKHWKIN